MRIRPALILLLCLLVTGRASASGTNLSWNRCSGEDGATRSRTFACNSNAGTNLLVASFVLDSPMSLVSGTEVYLNIKSAAPTLPAWWQFKNTGTCRSTALGINFVANAADVNCVDWAAGQSSGGIGFYTVGVNGANTVRVGIAVAVPLAALGELNAGTDYFTCNVTINNQKTVGTSSCSGCSTPACISIEKIKVTTNTSGGSGDVTLTTPASGTNSNYVYWQAIAPDLTLPDGSCSELDSAAFFLNTSVSGRGLVARSTTRQKYTPGTPVQLIAVPSAGDRFVAWSGDTTSTRDTLDITVYRDLTYFATFDRDPAASPTITAVSDVPNDQGGKVQAIWPPGPLDTPSLAGTICCYRVERSLTPTFGSPWVTVSTNINANSLSQYSAVVTSPGDSVAGSSAAYLYRVVAVASGGTAEWASAPIAGYSVDNLPPPPLASVSGAQVSGTANIVWSAVSTPDFHHFAIYRDPHAAPVIDPAHRIGTTTGNSYLDSPGYFAYYLITVVDTHGNESTPTAFVPLNSADTPAESAPRALSLGRPTPSPMRSAVKIRLGLPRSGPVDAIVSDAQGRVVRRLLQGANASGWQTLEWNGKDERGERSAPGVYFVRAVSGAETVTKRLILLP